MPERHTFTIFPKTARWRAGVFLHVRSVPYAAVAIALLTAAAVRAEEPHVTVEIVPSVTAVEPGGKLTVAAVFKIENHWHLYWINPGETGTPPDIKWTAPAGVTVGPAQFPMPKTINSGGLTAYGYEDRLVLLYDVTVPKDASGEIKLNADANWIVCSDSCVAEGQKLNFKLPVTATRGAENHPEQLKIWRAEQPTRDEKPVAATINADGKHGTIEMTISPGQTFAEFFPPQADFVEWEKPVIDGNKLRVRFRVLPGPPASHAADAITVFNGQGGKVAVVRQVQFRF